MGLNEMTEGAGANLILQKVYGVVGAPSPIMASELFPQVVVRNDRPEWPFLEGDRIAAGVVSDGAVVGQISHVGLINPVDSGVLVIVKEFLIAQGTAQRTNLIFIGQNVEATDTTAPGAPRDSRFQLIAVGGPETTALLFTLTQVGTITAAPIATVSFSDTFRYDQPIVLGPGGFLMVRGSVSNEGLTVSFSWLEQKAASGELQGVRV